MVWQKYAADSLLHYGCITRYFSLMVERRRATTGFPSNSFPVVASKRYMRKRNVITPNYTNNFCLDKLREMIWVGEMHAIVDNDNCIINLIVSLHYIDSIK